MQSSLRWESKNQISLQLQRLQRKTQRCFLTEYCFVDHSGIDEWNFVIFEQWETHKQLEERETVWQQKLKTCYRIGLNEKEEYLY